MQVKQMLVELQVTIQTQFITQFQMLKYKLQAQKKFM